MKFAIKAFAAFACSMVPLPTFAQSDIEKTMKESMVQMLMAEQFYSCSTFYQVKAARIAKASGDLKDWQKKTVQESEGTMGALMLYGARAKDFDFASDRFQKNADGTAKPLDKDNKERIVKEVRQKYVNEDKIYLDNLSKLCEKYLEPLGIK